MILVLAGGNQNIQGQVTLHYTWPTNNTADPTKTYTDTIYLTQVCCA